MRHNIWPRLLVSEQNRVRWKQGNIKVLTALSSVTIKNHHAFWQEVTSQSHECNKTSAVHLIPQLTLNRRVLWPVMLRHKGQGSSKEWLAFIMPHSEAMKSLRCIFFTHSYDSYAFFIALRIKGWVMCKTGVTIRFSLKFQNQVNL